MIESLSLGETRMRNPFDVIVLGGGAAGLMCAAEAGRRGRTVLVIEHAPRVAQKVLISGGGRCNFTNLHAGPEDYISQNPHFCKSVLVRFTPSDFIAMMEEHEIPYHEKKSGQLFCRESSARIVGMLLKRCSDASVEIWVHCRVVTVRKESPFIVETSRGTIQSRSLVVATGGLSHPKLGATDLGYRLAKQFGLKIIPPRPALVPLTFGEKDRDWSDLAGLSVDAVASGAGHSFRESILFTHRGLSGPAILQASSYWSSAEPITITLSPETDFLKLFEAHRSSRIQMKNLLSNHLPRRFAEKWCERNGLSKALNQYSAGELRRIAADLSSWKITPAGTEGYKTAEVTRGGVDTNDLSSKTMEARKVPGLYFIGEVVDVTGRLGGFNLHWAWASGAAAGACV